MADERITLIVEGTERDGGHVRLDVFVSQLKQLYAVLSRIDESIAHGEHRNTHFAIVGLSHSSPAMVELEPRVNRSRQDVRGQITKRLVNAIESVERDDLRPDTDYALLMDLRNMAASVGNQLRSSTLRVSGGSFHLTPMLAKKIEVHLEEHESCIGTIEGMLERINVHDDANIFTIYPDVGPKSVPCHFPNELVESALAAGKRRVAVTGVMKYRKLAQYPYHINADQLEIYDLEDALPSFDDLHGIAPDATGEMPAADFIARFRDGWV